MASLTPTQAAALGLAPAQTSTTPAPSPAPSVVSTPSSPSPSRPSSSSSGGGGGGGSPSGGGSGGGGSPAPSPTPAPAPVQAGLESQLAPNQSIIPRSDGTYFVRTFTGNGQYVDSTVARVGEYVYLPEAAAKSAEGARSASQVAISQGQAYASPPPMTAPASDSATKVSFDYIRQQGTLADQLFVAQQVGLPLATVQERWDEFKTKLGSKSYTALTESGISEAKATGKAFIPGIGSIYVDKTVASLTPSASPQTQQPISSIPYRPSPLKPVSLFPTADDRLAEIRAQVGAPGMSLAQNLALVNEAAQVASQKYGGIQQLPPSVNQSLALSPVQKGVMEAGAAIEGLPIISFLKMRGEQTIASKSGDFLGDTSKEFTAGVIRSPEMLLKTGVAAVGFGAVVATGDKQAMAQGAANVLPSIEGAVTSPSFWVGILGATTLAGLGASASASPRGSAAGVPLLEIEPKTTFTLGSRTNIIAQTGPAGPQIPIAEVGEVAGRTVSSIGAKSGLPEGSTVALGLENSKFSVSTSPVLNVLGKPISFDFLRTTRTGTITQGEIEALGLKTPEASTGPYGAQPNMLVQTKMAQSFTPSYDIPVLFGKEGAPILPGGVFGKEPAPFSGSGSYTTSNIPIGGILPADFAPLLPREAPVSISASIKGIPVKSFSEISPEFVRAIQPKDVTSVSTQPTIEAVDAIRGFQQPRPLPEFPPVREIRTIFAEEGGKPLASTARVQDLAVEQSGQNVLYKGLIPEQRVGGQLVSGTVVGEVYSPFGGLQGFPGATRTDIFPTKPIGGGAAAQIEVLGPSVGPSQLPGAVIEQARQISAGQAQVGLEIAKQAGGQSEIPRVSISAKDVAGATAQLPSVLVVPTQSQQNVLKGLTLVPPKEDIAQLLRVGQVEIQGIVGKIAERQDSIPNVRIEQPLMDLRAVTQGDIIRQIPVQVPEILQPPIQRPIEIQTPQQQTIRITTPDVPPPFSPPGFAPSLIPPLRPELPPLTPPFKLPFAPQGEDASKVFAILERRTQGKYVPSLTAQIFNIRGKPGATEVTGFAVRPIPIGKASTPASRVDVLRRGILGGRKGKKR